MHIVTRKDQNISCFTICFHQYYKTLLKHSVLLTDRMTILGFRMIRKLIRGILPLQLSTNVSATSLEQRISKQSWRKVYVGHGEICMVTTVINHPGYFDTEHTAAVLPVAPSTNLCGQLTISRLQTSLTVVVRNALKRRHLPLRLPHHTRCGCSSYHIDQCLFDSVQQSAKLAVQGITSAPQHLTA